MSTITIPGVGPVKSAYVYAGGAVVVGAVGYSYWRRGTASAADVVDVDQLPDDAGTADVGDGWGNVPGRTGDSGGGWVPDGDRDPATAAEWTREAVERMSNIGYDGQAIAQAIGLWLGLQDLSATQADWIRTVKAIMPAVPGVPEPPIRIGLPTPPGGGGGGGTKPPGTKPPAGRPPAPALHHVLRDGRGRIVMQWNAAAGATSYVVYYTGGPKTGVNVGNRTSHTLTGLPAGRKSFSVASVNAAGRSGTTSKVVSQVVQ